MREYLKMVWRDLCHDEFREDPVKIMIFMMHVAIVLAVETMNFLLRLKKGERVFGGDV